MSEPNDVTSESSPAQVEPTSEGVKTPASEPAQKTEGKTVPYSRFKEVADELKVLKGQPPKEVNKNLDVDDYIDISASLQGLDAREQAFIAQQHKLTGKPLKEIKSSEDFSLWQSAYRAKVERDNKSLPPSTRQPETPEVLTLEQKIERANSLPNTAEGMREKEKILTESGLIDSTAKWRADRTNIGLGR